MTDPATIIAGMSEAERDALMQFPDDTKCKILWAENHDEAILAHRMMEMGLVAYLGCNGLVGMEIRPLGLRVRAALRERGK